MRDTSRSAASVARSRRPLPDGLDSRVGGFGPVGGTAPAAVDATRELDPARERRVAGSAAALRTGAAAVAEPATGAQAGSMLTPFFSQHAVTLLEDAARQRVADVARGRFRAAAG